MVDRLVSRASVPAFRPIEAGEKETRTPWLRSGGTTSELLDAEKSPLPVRSIFPSTKLAVPVFRMLSVSVWLCPITTSPKPRARADNCICGSPIGIIDKSRRPHP